MSFNLLTCQSLSAEQNGNISKIKCKGQFTLSESERKSEKDQRTSVIDQRKKFNHQRKFLLWPSLLLSVNGPEKVKLLIEEIIRQSSLSEIRQRQETLSRGSSIRRNGYYYTFIFKLKTRMHSSRMLPPAH